MSKLLQIKVSEDFAEKLLRFAKERCLSMSAFVKTVLNSKMKDLERDEITENGFLREEEESIANSVVRTRKEREEGKLKTASVDDFIDSL